MHRKSKTDQNHLYACREHRKSYLIYEYISHSHNLIFTYNNLFSDYFLILSYHKTSLLSRFIITIYKNHILTYLYGCLYRYYTTTTKETLDSHTLPIRVGCSFFHPQCNHISNLSTKNFYPPDHPYRKNLLKAGLQKKYGCENATKITVKTHRLT